MGANDLSEFPAKVVELMIEKFSTVFARAEGEFQVSEVWLCGCVFFFFFFLKLIYSCYYYYYHFFKKVKFERTSLVDQGREVRLNDYRRSFRSQTYEDEEGEGEGEDEDDDEGEEGEGEMGGGGAALGTIVKEGWLSKKGDVRRNWTRRWFVLKYGSLAYFKTQGLLTYKYLIYLFIDSLIHSFIHLLID